MKVGYPNSGAYGIGNNGVKVAYSRSGSAMASFIKC